MSKPNRVMPEKFNVLATYNSEVARGILHSPAWLYKMYALQTEFDKWRDEDYTTSTFTP